MEFIPTSPIDEDCIASARNSTNPAGETNAVNTVNTLTSCPPAQKAVSYSINPEGIKFVPQPPVQFYYSLQVNSVVCV